MTPDETLESTLYSPWYGRIAGPVLAVLVFFLLPEGEGGLGHAGRATAACAVLMAVWWMTEALPIAVTSLLPIVLFPLTGVYASEIQIGDWVEVKQEKLRGKVVRVEPATDTIVVAFPSPDAKPERSYPRAELDRVPKDSPIKRAAAPYANPFVFLYLGGFLLALAIERWNLHRRLALQVVLAVGTRPSFVVGGFMLATFALSMWISNTATTAMMLPIALSVVGLLSDVLAGNSPSAAPPDSRAAEADLVGPFATSLMLGIAYAASIGGMATLVGTPTNVFMAGFLKEKGIDVGFGPWMAFALPTSLVYLAIAWWLMTQVIFRGQGEEIEGGRELLDGELDKLGPMSRGEWTVLVVFLGVALLWIVQTPLTKWKSLTDAVPAVAQLDDTLIGLAGALLLFLLPVDWEKGEMALDWRRAEKIPWGVLLLFGGGFSLADAFSSSGLDGWIGRQIDLIGDWPVWTIVLALTIVVIYLTELTSNTATCAALLPIAYAAALRMEISPLLFAVPVTLAASCAFMLPVATPPNAIVFGSGRVTMSQMMRAGGWLNIVGIVLVPLCTYTLGAWILGILGI